MFTGKKLINIISLILTVSVSILFLIKYAVIYNFYAAITVPVYFLLITGLIITAGNANLDSILNKKIILLKAVLFSAAVLIYILAVPRMGEIGRLPALEDWLSRFLNGKFPYNSPHTPSSYPAMFLIAYPFYISGNTGLLEFIGIILFFIILFIQNDTPRGMIIKIIILVTGITTYYEIVTRSELFFNMMLVAAAVYLCEKYLDAGKINFNFIWIAVVTGLALSTRSTAALLFVIYFIYRFRYNLRNLVLFGIISLIVFAALLLPFRLWDPESFNTNGPFAVQTYLSNLPLILIFIFFISAIYAGWVISDIHEFFFAGGIILFFAAAVSFISAVSETGFYDTLINDGYDIAYFIFCVPLLILSINDYRVDRFLGKTE